MFDVHALIEIAVSSLIFCSLWALIFPVEKILAKFLKVPVSKPVVIFAPFVLVIVGFAFEIGPAFIVDMLLLIFLLLLVLRLLTDKSKSLHLIVLLLFVLIALLLVVGKSEVAEFLSILSFLILCFVLVRDSLYEKIYK